MFFVSQKLSSFFCQEKDKTLFLSWGEDLKQKEEWPVDSPIRQEQKKIKEELISFFSEEEVSGDSVKKIIRATRGLIEAFSQNPVAERQLADIERYDFSIYGHSLAVANLAVYLGINSGYSQQKMLEYLYLGGLLHDYGKIKVDINQFSSFEDVQYKTALLKHPQMGKTALLLDNEFPEEVLKIIEQHHERFDGKGTPKGLRGHKIYELTKIVTLANEYDNFLKTAKGDMSQKRIQAIEFLKKNAGIIFDPKITAKAVKALEFLLVKV